MDLSNLAERIAWVRGFERCLDLYCFMRDEERCIGRDATGIEDIKRRLHKEAKEAVDGFE